MCSPFDLNTGAGREADEVQRRLEQRFDQIEQIAAEARLSEWSRQKIAKARRVPLSGGSESVNSGASAGN